VSKRLRTIRLVLAVLMLLMLLLPVPWVYYGSGHYLFGLHFVSACWWSFISFFRGWLGIPASSWSVSLWGLHLRGLLLLNWAVFAGGFALLALCKMFPEAPTLLWR
jgi:hypothetical protein